MSKTTSSKTIIVKLRACSLWSQADMHRGKYRSFELQEKVFVKTVSQDKVSWTSRQILKVVSPVTYTVKGDGNRLVHADHLKKELN